MKQVEYRVREVTRWIVTRFEADHTTGSGGCEVIGEFDSESGANRAARDAAFTEKNLATGHEAPLSFMI